ncbi:MAG TPA: pilus assembly protein TadG-related protein [candidate division Zixibacteria bacterium]|nr:pilus assembly protein TadG-related protein [candidate division Zixibacteria bacterium]
MSARSSRRDAPRGQVIVLFAVTLTLIVFAVGLVVDGGMGLAQRRGAQNAADFAALAGARIIAQRLGGDTVNGTDANVQAAITNAMIANGSAPPTFGPPNGPRYVADDGTLLNYVGEGLPADAVGVTVSSWRTWQPFFAQVFGVNRWETKATATARGGFYQDGPPPGSLFPAGIALSFFQTYPFCSGPISDDPTDPCYPKKLTPGNLNVPGGFGWLKFGCDGYGLGQEPPANEGGCRNDIPFLNEQIGPPGNSFGCCTQVGLAGSLDRIGSLPGNKASADCDYYIDNEVTVMVPIWDVAGGTGQNAWYHIVGFAGFQITQCEGGKNLEGVWRKPFMTGPVGSRPAGPVEIQMLGVQLVN